MNDININREEYKYFINNADVLLLGKNLTKILNKDSNSDIVSKHYTISSLYFDTPDSKDLNEKLDGILNRKKYRIRLYNKDLKTIKLELKKKVGTFITKESVFLSRYDAKNLILGEYDKIKNSNDVAKIILINMQALGYKPRVIVEYDRQAYYHPHGNIRITLDKNLRTFNSNIDILNLKNSLSTPVFFHNDQILEIKFSKSLPSFLSILLSNFQLKRCAISKYTIAQRFIDASKRRDHLIAPFWLNLLWYIKEFALGGLKFSD